MTWHDLLLTVTDLTVADSEVRHEVSLTEDILRSAGVATLVSLGDGQDGELVSVLHLQHTLSLSGLRLFTRSGNERFRFGKTMDFQETHTFLLS